MEVTVRILKLNKLLLYFVFTLFYMVHYYWTDIYSRIIPIGHSICYPRYKKNKFGKNTAGPHLKSLLNQFKSEKSSLSHRTYPDN